MKRVLALLCVLACLAALCIPCLAAEDNMVPVIVKVPGDWTNANLYAWDMDGNAAQSWPGTPMQKLDDGWYVGYMSLDMMNVIINGATQTVDLEVDWGEYNDGVWITLGEPDPNNANGYLTAEIKYDKQNTSSVPAYADAFYTLHVSVPSEWHTANVWAWDDNNVNAFGAWPGEAMTKGSDGWYTVQVPAFAKNFLIAEKDGGAQTVDYKGNGKEQWVVLGEADADGNLALTVTDTAPEGYEPPEEAEKPAVDTVTVHAAVPESWTEVRVWAWDDSQNNVYEAWPGEAMTKAEDGWYTLEVPGWFTNIIINNGGSSQTADLAVEGGKDLWLNVTDPTNVGISYEATELPEAPVVEDPKPTEPSVTDPAEDDKSGDENKNEEEKPATDWDSIILIGGIVVAVLVVIAGAVVIVIILKKNKKA